MRWLAAIPCCLASAMPFADGQHAVSAGWAEERVTLAGATQRVSMPSFSGAHLWADNQNTKYKLLWGAAPIQPKFSNPEQLLEDMDANLVELSAERDTGTWSWIAGIKTALLGDPNTQPLTIYAADFDQEQAITEQLLLGLGWKNDQVKIDAEIFRASPLEHPHIGRQPPGLTRASGLTDTSGFESWSLAVQGQQPFHWRVEHAHLSTRKAGEYDSDQWEASFSGPLSTFKGHRWAIDLNNYQHFRGTQANAREWMLSWSLPLATGIVQITRAKRISSPDNDLDLTELAYSVSPLKNLSLIAGISTTHSAPGKGRAIGLVLSYLLHKSP